MVQEIGFTHIDDFLKVAVEYDASDLHLSPTVPPSWRLHGDLKPIWDEIAPLTGEQTEVIAKSFLTENQWKDLDEFGDVDFAYEQDFGRFRFSVVLQRHGYEIVCRVINTTIRTMEQLGLPKENILPLTKFHNGLILVTGAVGSGKSSTLAAIIEQINMDRNDHIITLEDPIEYLFESKGCHVNQREIPTHTDTFASALKASLREDPDVIVVGEMRDLETIQLALTAAETGHLVLGTLHTSSAPRTIDRILDVFPTDQREQIRTMVAESLRGVISQQLIPKADGTGRTLAMELLVNTSAVASCIRDGKTFMLPGIMQTGKTVGMSTMDEALKVLVDQELISKEEAQFRAADKNQMKIDLNL